MTERSFTSRIGTTLKGENFDLAMKLLVPLLCLALGAAVKAVVDHETRLGVIENTRYTSEDAKGLADAAASERTKIQSEFSEALKEAANSRKELKRELEGVKKELGQANTKLAVSQAASVSAAERLGRLEVKLDEVLKELRK